ncbi:hypothetical protein [Streptomyces sp. NPDC059209]
MALGGVPVGLCLSLPVEGRGAGDVERPVRARAADGAASEAGSA